LAQSESISFSSSLCSLCLCGEKCGLEVGTVAAAWWVGGGNRRRGVGAVAAA